jgi:RHS repeat-associated protein
MFNAKEKDEESGLYYYEARYYSDENIMFTARDPKFEKYFWLSPYAYCANNPVIYIDPTGEDVEITGEGGQAIFEKLQKVASNLKLTRDGESGKLDVAGTPITKYEQKLYDAITSDKVTVQIEVDIMTSNWGEYHGTIYDSETGKATSTNKINLGKVTSLENEYKAEGVGVLHEITEGYEMGLIARKEQRNIEGAYFKTEWTEAPGLNMEQQVKVPKNETDYRLYERGHSRATPEPKGWKSYLRFLNKQSKKERKHHNL